MNTKSRQQKSANISDVNKQILEIKKKIQLSEGQRKALFEVCEAECKTNSDEILKLKKEISQLVLALRESRSTSAKTRVKSSRLQATMGSLGEKDCNETQELLDLQNIDKTKQLNLIRYRIQQRQNYLTKLANEYQLLVSEKGQKEVIQRVENPVKLVTSELQNNIHAVKIQWREALHVYNRYQDIKKSLQQDSARFEFNIKCVEEQLHTQAGEIERLQKIAEEASQMRGTARAALLQQEKAALNAGKARDHQESEGRRLVTKGKQELEKLERRIFQSGKAPVRSEPDTGDENQTGREISVPQVQSENGILDIFEILKQATGSTSTEEVVERFRSQRDTDVRLNRLRNSSEIEKRQMEKKQESLTNELERYKYAEAKDAEQNLEEVERLRNAIQEQKDLTQSYEESVEKTETVTQSVSRSLNGLYIAIHPLAVVELDPHMVLNRLQNELQEIMAEVEQVAEPEPVMIEKLEIDEEKWLPPPYSGLVRRTPIPQEGASPIPPPAGSDDEEEVPTRGYLKRQAQLVVDARSRRKNIRIQRKTMGLLRMSAILKYLNATVDRKGRKFYVVYPMWRMPATTLLPFVSISADVKQLNTVTNKELEDSMKSWLRRAKERAQMEARKNTS